MSVCRVNFVPAGILLVFAFALKGAAETVCTVKNAANMIAKNLFFIDTRFLLFFEFIVIDF